MPAQRTVTASLGPSRSKPLWLLLFTAFVFLFCASFPPHSYGQRRPNQQLNRKREVVKVRIEGNEHITTNELSAWITTRPSSWIERFLHSISSSFGRPRQYVDDAIIVSDTESISEYYRANGYLEVRVGVRYDENPDDVAEWNRLRDVNRFLAPSQQERYPDIRTTVVFIVTEGPVYKVAGFTFAGLEGLPPDLLTRVTEDLGIARGSVYSADAVIKEDERVRTLLGENGYPFFRRDSIVVESIAGTKTVGISVYFQTGHRYRMGDLKIVYDTLGARGRVSEATISRQIPYEKGSWIKLSILNEGERNLYTLGTFDIVFITPDTSVVAGVPDSLRDSLALPIIVDLRMQITIDVAPGIFVASGRSSDLAAGLSLAFNHRNLFGGAEKFSAQASWQFLPVSQSRWDVGTSVEFPYVGPINAPLELGANFFYLQEKNSFLERSYSGHISSRINIPHANTSIRPGFAVEYLRRAIFDSSLLKQLKLPNNEQFNLIFTNQALYDVTNDFFNPSTGISISYGLEIGIPILQKIFREDLPSAHYIKNSLQFRKFFDLDGIGKSVLAFRALGGAVSLIDPGNPSRDIPLTRRFLIGGPASLRGWPSTVLLMARDTANVTALVGGYKIIEGNVEWRFAPFRYDEAFGFFEQLLSDLRLGLFVDAGNLWNKDTPILLKNFAVASGIGLRYNTLFGAIRVDWGLKLYDPAPGLKESYNPDTDPPPPATPIDTKGLWLWEKVFNFNRDSEIQISIGLPF